MLQDWFRLAGQLNWALNVDPWLRPGLGGIYEDGRKDSDVGED